jgi:response regulator NasT
MATQSSPVQPVLQGARVVGGLRIVIAADEPATIKFYKEFCSSLGHDVCVAATGPQLLEQAKLLRPDLVISEVRLPELDGIVAAEAICRERPTPIVLVVEQHDEEIVRRALDNSCVLVCLCQPVKEVDVRLALALAMRRFQQHQAVCQEVADLRQTLEDRKIIERAKGLVMRFAGVDEEEAFRRLRRMASNQNQKLAQVAETVLLAGDVFHQMEESHETANKGHTPNGSGRKGRGPAFTAVRRDNSVRPPLPQGTPRALLGAPQAGNGAFPDGQQEVEQKS